MNKAELIEALAADFDGNKAQAAKALKAVTDTITYSTARGEKVSITGFGVFESVRRPARMVRNPRTGERKRAKATSVPKFRAGSDLKAYVSGEKKPPRATAKKAAAKTTASRTGATKTAATKSAATKTAATKTTATKSTAKKAAAKKSSPAKKATPAKTASPAKTAAKKSPAKKAPAKKAVAKKAPAKKAPAKKATAKRTAKKA
ncbi:HU family DNA-binding protein [Microlunatus sp. Gsoil 973]|uniref:HU family DNA-binding protein n=1 Tax=Microlunatus sp. Gsoil 973 TaxID=2672569 RepID=UPI0012B46BA1|nr:HU family DNA-binding protein [Microlunatus sp. Gsoil 973]QGN33092.1 HU family DNA-binding protein [Microlunatus sp. Gsoil 973]